MCLDNRNNNKYNISTFSKHKMEEDNSMTKAEVLEIVALYLDGYRATVQAHEEGTRLMIEVARPDFNNPPAYRNDDTHSVSSSYQTNITSNNN